MSKRKCSFYFNNKKRRRRWRNKSNDTDLKNNDNNEIHKKTQDNVHDNNVPVVVGQQRLSNHNQSNWQTQIVQIFVKEKKENSKS